MQLPWQPMGNFQMPIPHRSIPIPGVKNISGDSTRLGLQDEVHILLCALSGNETSHFSTLAPVLMALSCGAYCENSRNSRIALRSLGVTARLDDGGTGIGLDVSLSRSMPFSKASILGALSRSTGPSFNTKWWRTAARYTLIVFPDSDADSDVMKRTISLTVGARWLKRSCCAN